MTRYLLDTNIISNATKPLPSPRLLEWMAEQADDDLFISSLSLRRNQPRRTREAGREKAQRA
jgi:toxin FitB